jgi:type II secretory pathway pseudopilin PulG
MMMEKSRLKSRQLGFNLLELAIGLLIFSIGMLALASLQGNLTRSQADASVRSVATNIAEETIELIRGFGRIDADPAGLIPAYADIRNRAATVSRGGIDYTVMTAVTDYYYDLASDGFGTGNPDNLLVSDFKEVTVTVSWGSTPGFRISDSQEISAVDIGSGGIALTDVISSITTQGAGQTSTQEQNHLLLPDVSYSPGANPDIISLQLGETRFKESTSPKPRVYRAEELVETRFDVITYSQSDSGALFLRREEFIAVSCDCELQAPPVSAFDAGRSPSLWVGDEYETGEFQVKPYGTSASNQQSIFCDVCCRDHHDGGTVTGDPAAARYNPFRSATEIWPDGSFAGDHKHYNRDRRGELVLADRAGSHYVEACRLVRVDGFMRVGQDLRQEGRNLFPENYLDEVAEIDDYSDWVTVASNSFENALVDGYESAPPQLAPPPMAPEPGGFPTRTTIPTSTGMTTQQLRSRGIYIDYLRDDLRTAIDCLRSLPESGEAPDCDSDTIAFDRSMSKNVLEVIPFFDVQLTWLNRWYENPANAPIDTSNEPVLTDNMHSRGMASRGGGSGSSDVYAAGHRGNLGLTDTDPVDPGFASELRAADIDVTAVNGDPPVEPGNIVIRGRISSGVPGLRATEILVEGINANCNRLPDGFACEFSSGTSDVGLKVFNYKKQGVILAACSFSLSLTSSGTDATGRGFAYFNLSPTPQLDPDLSHNISIESDACVLF